MSSLSKQSTETTTKSPYGPAEPAIHNILGAMDEWYMGGKGNQAALNPDTSRALKMTRTLAKQPVQGLAEAQQYNTGLIANGGWTDDLRQVQSYLDPFARGDYTEDPRLLAVIERERNAALNGAMTRSGGGRYGSAAMGRMFSDSASGATDQLMLQNNENARNRQLQATGLLGSLGEGARDAAMMGVSQLPMLDNLRYAGAERLAGVGDYRQNRKQEREDQYLGRIRDYGSMVLPIAGIGGTTTTPKKGGGLSGLIGSVGTGALIGNKLGGGWGAAIGGGLSGLAKLWDADEDKR